MSGPLTLQRAEALFRAGRLRELVGAPSDATPEQVKEASKQAYLKHHPDKGGDLEVFKIIRPATEALKLDEHACTFEGGRVPAWAKKQLDTIAAYRSELRTKHDLLHVAQAKLEAAQPGCAATSCRSKAKSEVAKHESGVANASCALECSLSHFKACYTEHVDCERARVQADEALLQQEASELHIDLQLANEKERVAQVKSCAARHARRTRPTSLKFPVMPRTVNDATARVALEYIKQQYQRLAQTTRKRAKLDRRAKYLELKSSALMAQARALVEQCCATEHAEAASRSKRFPTLPPSDPRAAALTKLCREHRRLARTIRGTTPDDHREGIRAKLSDVWRQAVELLADTNHIYTPADPPTYPDTTCQL